MPSCGGSPSSRPAARPASRSSGSAPPSAALPASRTPSRRDWERLSNRWRDDLDARIETLQALRDRLTTCIGCGCLSIDKCELLNPDDEAAAAGAGAHYLREETLSPGS